MLDYSALGSTDITSGKMVTNECLDFPKDNLKGCRLEFLNELSLMG